MILHFQIKDEPEEDVNQGSIGDSQMALSSKGKRK